MQDFSLGFNNQLPSPPYPSPSVPFPSTPYLPVLPVPSFPRLYLPLLSERRRYCVARRPSVTLCVSAALVSTATAMLSSFCTLKFFHPQ